MKMMSTTDKKQSKRRFDEVMSSIDELSVYVSGASAVSVTGGRTAGHASYCVKTEVYTLYVSKH